MPDATTDPLWRAHLDAETKKSQHRVSARMHSETKHLSLSQLIDHLKKEIASRDARIEELEMKACQSADKAHTASQCLLAEIDRLLALSGTGESWRRLAGFAPNYRRLRPAEIYRDDGEGLRPQHGEVLFARGSDVPGRAAHINYITRKLRLDDISTGVSGPEISFGDCFFTAERAAK